MLICDAQQHRLVGGVGDIKLTKDENTFLNEKVLNMLTVTLMMMFRCPLVWFLRFLCLLFAANPEPDNNHDCKSSSGA
jgi:hypothetical protein